MAIDNIDTWLLNLGARLGMQYSEEQKAFIADFTSPIISFSSPGTGKTKSAIGGLLTAELYHGIPGDNIYAVSFTRMATANLAIGHKKDGELLGLRQQTVHFQTLHAMCRRLLADNCGLLNISKLDTTKSLSLETASEILESTGKEYDLRIKPAQIRPLMSAINQFNSSLIYDRSYVESKYLFKMCGMSYEEFTMARKILDMYVKFTESLDTSYILPLTLELLMEHPEVGAEFKKKCRVLVVDEFQDMSLLQLSIVSQLSDNVIAIGDIKQQIFAFAGACQEIVPKFKEYYPNARELNINKSFRCADAIVEFSKKIIAPNNMGEENFVGTGVPGKVEITPNLPLGTICDTIEQQYRENRNIFPRNTLFLFRNNWSAIPIAEELFKRKIPFRVNNYVAASRVPVISEMCQIIELAINPRNLNNLNALRYILKEQRAYGHYMDSPIFKICQKEGCSIFEANYKFRDMGGARIAMELLLWVQDMVKQNKPLRNIFNGMFGVFQEEYLNTREPFLQMPSSYYLNMVKPLVFNKTYNMFISDEHAKMQVIEDSNARRYGVRCYTFHSAKGLEADDVYILDADANVIPNMSKLNEMDRKGCSMEQAREIRNERSLLFVAATRARENLTITYNEQISSMLGDINMFARYDELFAIDRPQYNDVEEFRNFYKGGLDA